jgi:hypothetical protein
VQHGQATVRAQAVLPPNRRREAYSSDAAVPQQCVPARLLSSAPSTGRQGNGNGACQVRLLRCKACLDGCALRTSAAPSARQGSDRRSSRARAARDNPHPFLHRWLVQVCLSDAGQMMNPEPCQLRHASTEIPLTNRRAARAIRRSSASRAAASSFRRFARIGRVRRPQSLDHVARSRPNRWTRA